MALPNSAAAITAQLTAMASPLPPLVIPCANAPASSTDKMDKCEKEQICAKCASVNDQAAKGKLKRVGPTGPGRNGGDAAATTFKRRQGMRLGGKGPFGRHLSRSVAPKDLKDFAADCAKEAWMKGDPPPKPPPPGKPCDPDMPGLSADHIHEIQLGGSPTSARNLRMMSSKANEWCGTTLQNYDPTKHCGVAPDCCT